MSKERALFKTVETCRKPTNIKKHQVALIKFISKNKNSQFDLGCHQ